MHGFLIPSVQITSITATRQPFASTPLRLSMQAKPSSALEQQIEFSLSTKNKYQRLPVRTIYEEISVLDVCDDSESSDFPVLFKSKAQAKLCAPVNAPLIELKGKSENPHNSKHKGKTLERSKKRNSNPNNSKAMHAKQTKTNDKNSFCFLSAEKLKELLEYSGNRKKLVQGDFVGNGAKKNTVSKRNLRAADVLSSHEEDQWTVPKQPELTPPNTGVVKEAIKACYFDLVDKITLKPISSARKKHKQPKARNNLLAVLNKCTPK
eukprot:TRINITY_DN16921_c0_g1_i1.p1 TRINITY_DN16921_c0_g1~~TRINITY_DN16921_c0_g1_i1.p1  ORF type:complete len:265 (+),score=52.19 TRINITY_DN16921_c0_g1_i1:141-935(+)